MPGAPPMWGGQMDEPDEPEIKSLEHSFAELLQDLMQDQITAAEAVHQVFQTIRTHIAATRWALDCSSDHKLLAATFAYYCNIHNWHAAYT